MNRSDPHELWEYVLTQIELSISPANFNTWFRESSIVKIEDGIAGKSSLNDGIMKLQFHLSVNSGSSAIK